MSATDKSLMIIFRIYYDKFDKVYDNLLLLKPCILLFYLII